MTWVWYLAAYIACIIASFFLTEFVVFAIVFAILYFKDTITAWISPFLKWIPFLHSDGYEPPADYKDHDDQEDPRDPRDLRNRHDRHVSFQNDF
jgi:hypothetical protein